MLGGSVECRPTLLVLACCFGCIDNEIIAKPDDTDTGEFVVETPDGGSHEGCVEINRNDWELPGSIDGLCHMFNADGVDVTGPLLGVRVEADAGSRTPDPSAEIHVIGDENESDIPTTYPISSNFKTSPLFAGPSSDAALEWTAETAAAAELDTLDDCSPSCHWDWVVVTIDDPVAFAANECHLYMQPELRVCFIGSSPAEVWPSPARREPAAARCQPGKGRFRMVPVSQVKKSGSSSRKMVLRPIQVDGSGVLTSSAKITKAMPLEETANGVEVLRATPARPTVAFQQRVAGATSLVPLAESSLELTGGTSFFLDSSSYSYSDPPEIDLEWTCPAPEAVQRASVPAGYVASLSELACVADWPQRVTLRPSGSFGRRSMSIELYGMLDLSRAGPLLPTADGEHFRLSEGGLTVEGSLLSESPNGALVALEKVEFNRVPLCLPGLYQFPKE